MPNENADAAPPEKLVLDTSVLVRFFHRYGDPLDVAARRLREWWLDELVELVLLDLSVYELTNVLVRILGRSGAEAGTDLEALFGLELPVVRVDERLASDAARLAAERGLSGYDAAFVAAARRLRIPLLTADRRLADRCPDEALLLVA